MNYPKASDFLIFLVFPVYAAICSVTALPAAAADAPAWMHALVSVPLPAHDEKTSAILLYSEDVTTVEPTGKIKTLRRRAFKILRPDGREYGKVFARFTPETRITSMHAWCIPAQGKDYEVKEKDAIETTPIEAGGLATDVRVKIITIPAAEPGNIVGYEIDQEKHAYVLESDWEVQTPIPVRESRFTLQLPPGWEYKAVWVNHPDVAPTSTGNNQFQWSLTGLEAIKEEAEMPPWEALGARLVIAMLPPGGGPQSKSFVNWRDMGLWYGDLTRGRRDPSPEIKQKVVDLTSSKANLLTKMAALAVFMQTDIRYVGIWLGIGGFQPHAATDVFTHRYGDCKDKATLMSAMLQQLGVDSYYVVINTERGGVTGSTPPQLGGFNHVVLAIKLPAGVNDPTLVATMRHPKLGTLLFFDPTDQVTPFGHLRGALQANYGLLVTPDGGELTPLPQLPSTTNAIHRHGKFTITSSGELAGEVTELRFGDRATQQRRTLKAVSKDSDRIKPIEELLGNSLSSFRITKASISNLEQNDQPFGVNYSLVAANYAKTAGDLLLIRPRVIGAKGSAILETKEPRHYPLEFPGPAHDVDSFEIAIPQGYAVDDLPPAVDLDYSFASYHSKTEASGNALHYTRSFEIKELSVPMDKMDELKKFYRAIAGDERNTAVLKPTAN